MAEPARATLPVAPTLARPVVLVGMMGSGKSSIGKRVASRLGVPFVDLDLAFESMARQTIRETFETHGEAWFRAREAELLRGTADLADAVVALGGGTFTFPENQAFVKKHGLSIFLDVPFDVIAERLAGKALDRPLFGSPEAARALYEARLPFYRMADWTVPVTKDLTLDELVDGLELALHRLDRLDAGAV